MKKSIKYILFILSILVFVINVTCFGTFMATISYHKARSNLYEGYIQCNTSIETRIYTLWSLQEFLWNDTTDTHKYDVDKYNCQNFAKDLAINATLHGFRCGIVNLNYDIITNGHVINVFETVLGYIFVEPQDDSILCLYTYPKEIDYMQIVWCK